MVPAVGYGVSSAENSEILASRNFSNLAFESKSSILSVSEMAVALEEVLARELERGRRLRCGLRTADDDVVSTLPSVTLKTNISKFIQLKRWWTIQPNEQIN